MPRLLVSLCARLRNRANAGDVLSRQAHAAIEALWADNRTLTIALLEIDRGVHAAMASSHSISSFGQLKGAGERDGS